MRDLFDAFNMQNTFSGAFLIITQLASLIQYLARAF